MRNQLSSPLFIVLTSFFANLYFTLVMLFLNWQLLSMALWDSRAVADKLRLIDGLFWGGVNSTTTTSLFLLIIISILFGANLALIIKKLLKRRDKKISVKFGLGAFLGFLSGGCVSCGLPILAMLGLTSIAALMPFGGVEFSLMAIGILGLSLYGETSKSCKIN